MNKEEALKVEELKEVDVEKNDKKLAKFITALRKTMNDRGLSGSISVGLGIDAGFADFDLGWTVTMDGPSDGDGDLEGKDEKAAADSVDMFMDVSNDIKRKALRWRIPMSVTVSMLVGIVTLEATLEVNPQKEPIDKTMEEVLAADWGNMTISDTNAFILLKPKLVCRDGKPVNNAMSKWSFARAVSNAFDKLKESLIKSSKSMEACGFHGALSGGITVKVPTILTFGIKTFEIGVSVEIQLTDMLAAQQLHLEDLKLRTGGKLTVELKEGRNLPIMDLRTSDPYVIASIEGGKKEDKRRSKTCLSTLNPEWNQVLEPMPCAPKGEVLIISLYDEDTGRSDDFMDEWIIPLDKLELTPGVAKHIIAPLKGRTDSNIGFTVKWESA